MANPWQLWPGLSRPHILQAERCTVSNRVALHHRTEYKFDRSVRLSPHIIRLRPAPHCRTHIESYSLQVEPRKQFLNWQQDPYGNYLARLVFPDAAPRLRIDVDLVANLTVINPFDFFLEEGYFHFPFTYTEDQLTDLAPYLKKETPGPLLKKAIAGIPRHKQQTLDFLVEVNRKLQEQIAYVIRMEPGVQRCEETLEKESGSCRDTSWLLVQMLRHCGIAARFVSGYLIQLKADVKPVEGPEGPEEDFTDLHAWTEVYLPGAGWVGLDPTSGLLAGEGHIPLACTPDPTGAAPVVGSLEKCETEFEFAMSVQRIWEMPRISKPFSDSAWADIDALGLRVDAALRAQDVRLTMGGEPTFVSDIDREDEQWHTAALGDEKWQKGVEMFDRLSKRFAAGAVHHVGQGKWYPGERLPRWSFDCFWLKDGTPLWRNPADRGDPRKDYGFTDADADMLMQALCSELEVSGKLAIPAYEDVFYYLWRERRLPGNVDPLDSKLDDPEERAQLMKVFDQGLEHVVGYALPLRAVYGGPDWHWESGEWFLRTERMYLMPGDSPMGLRLPLDSLPWEVETERHTVYTADPAGWPARSSKAGWPELQRQLPTGRKPSAVTMNLDPMERTARSGGVDYPAGIVRTALCVEARNGRVHVFMPPLDEAPQYFALVRAIENAAAKTGVPVILEGYDPPFDPRINSFSIRPDPGVLEINIHPAASWKERKEIAFGLYEDARETRLSAEKYAVDGRATGTGGGGHLVLGGPTPVESPFLRRPDLLRSMLSFWHNHPGLSYLFTGLFVGPTSQAPRVDEARNDMTAELEVAFRQLSREGATPPWLVDRLFRNLLVELFEQSDDLLDRLPSFQSCLAASIRSSNWSSVMGSASESLNRPPLKRFSLVVSACENPPPSIVCQRPCSMSAAYSVLPRIPRNKLVKLFSGISATSSANMVKRQRIKKRATFSGSWPWPSNERPSLAKRSATSRVTRALTRDGSSALGLVQISRKRSRVFSSLRSSSLTRKRLASGNCV